MKTKILLSVSAFVGATIILAMVAWQGLPSDSSIVGAQPLSKTNIDSSFSDTNLIAFQLSMDNKISLTAIINGLTAEIREYDLNPEYPTITICTDIPSVADWLPIFSASYKDNPIDVWQVMLIDPQNTAYQEKNRCYLAMLTEGIIQPDESGILTFSIEYFQMSVPERLPDDLIAKAKKYLLEKGINIDFEIKDVDHGQAIVITEKPTKYTDEESYQIIQDAIEQSIDKVYGPWIFTIDLSQK